MSDFGHIKEVYIPDGWSSQLCYTLLNYFNKYLNESAKFLKQNQTQQQLTDNIEIEFRFGTVSNDTFTFTPGIDKDIFNGMRNYFLRLLHSNSSKWYQEPQSSYGVEKKPNETKKNSLVRCHETDYLDILFDDNIRITVRLYFSDVNLTKLSKIKVIEAIRKNKFEEETFCVKTVEKKQCFDLRIAVASEETVDLKTKLQLVKDHIDYAKQFIRKSYSFPVNSRIFGGSPITISSRAKTEDITLYPMSHTNLVNEDSLLKYAKTHNGKLSVNIARQMKWTLLQPKELPSLRGEDSPLLRNYSDGIVKNYNGLIYLTNFPSKITLRDSSTWVCSSNQYIISINFDLISCSQGKFAGSFLNLDEENDLGLKIVHFRRKIRSSFKLRPNTSLDMTRVQQSQNPAIISAEPVSYELEAEVNIDLNKIKHLRAVNLSIDLLKDISTYVYGIKLSSPLETIFQQEIWASAFENDKKRTALLQDIPDVTLRKRKAEVSVKKSPQKKLKTAQNEATSFYNQLNRSQNKRTESLIYHLRCFNNFAKSVLIQEYINKTLSEIYPHAASMEDIQKMKINILDLACGKGGDLNKFIMSVKETNFSKPCFIEAYVGIDIALQTLRDLVVRIERSKRQSNFSVTLGELDLGASGDILNDPHHKKSMKIWSKESLTWEDKNSFTFLKSLQAKFELVSIQFSLHYMFETKSKAESFFRFVSHCLKPSGHMISTTVEANQLVLRLLKAGPAEDGFKILDSKRRSLCEVTFDSEAMGRLFKKPTSKSGTKDQEDSFGLRYHFKLRDAEEEDSATVSVNAPEWMIPLPELYVLARKCGLKLLLYKNLTEFTKELIYENSDERQTMSYQRLMKRMNVLNCDGKMTGAEFNISSLYVAIAFQKVDEELPPSLPQLLRELKQNYPNFNLLSNKLKADLINSLKTYK